MSKAIRDDDAGLRLACLRAAIEIRSGSTTNDMLLETATLFHAFVTGLRHGDRAGNGPAERSAARSAERSAERTGPKPKRN
ncbi:MAG: hypothetical protein WD044_00025 [Dongiaceae bacterium]